MDAHMHLEITGIDKTFVANFTLKGSFSCVDTHMHIQITGIDETFVANSTFKGSFSTVDTHMHLQVTGVCEPFGTDITYKCSFSSVSTHMPFQVTGAGEAFGANLTLMGYRCGMNWFISEMIHHDIVINQFKQPRNINFSFRYHSKIKFISIVAVYAMAICVGFHL